MVTPQNGKRISKADTYLNCAEVLKIVVIWENVHGSRGTCTRETGTESAVLFMQKRMHY